MLKFGDNRSKEPRNNFNSAYKNVLRKIRYLLLRINATANKSHKNTEDLFGSI